MVAVAVVVVIDVVSTHEPHNTGQSFARRGPRPSDLQFSSVNPTHASMSFFPLHFWMVEVVVLVVVLELVLVLVEVDVDVLVLVVTVVAVTVVV